MDTQRPEVLIIEWQNVGNCANQTGRGQEIRMKGGEPLDWRKSDFENLPIPLGFEEGTLPKLDLRTPLDWREAFQRGRDPRDSFSYIRKPGGDDLYL